MARLSTVYDFSSLRLHPDGSRVQQSTSKNQKLRYAASVVQDSRGNWFAHDAAGSGAVGRYRKERKEKQEHEEEWNDIDEGEEDELSKRKRKGKEKETTGGRHDLRPAKRQKFLRDLDFLAPTASSGPSPTNALPSSDLLKSIHYFASSYYHERGQLFNATKEYRQIRKQNKLKRLEQQQKAKVDRKHSEELSEDSGQDEANRPRRGGRKRGVIGKTVHRKDMYKVLDGSVLMAIGMLIQEYVSRTLEVRIPDGWEDMIRNAYIDEETVTSSHEDEEDQSAGEDDDDEIREDEEDRPQQDNREEEEEEEEEGEEEGEEVEEDAGDSG
ncbi:hypothetical protein J132_02121 [Termitomyces sp. J132]|nr:hypothetical protein J132_02121 [Termitomyces sp. J132]